MVSSRDPLKWIRDLQRWGIKRSRLESPGKLHSLVILLINLLACRNRQLRFLKATKTGICLLKWSPTRKIQEFRPISRDILSEVVFALRKSSGQIWSPHTWWFRIRESPPKKSPDFSGFGTTLHETNSKFFPENGWLEF